MQEWTNDEEKPVAAELGSSTNAFYGIVQSRGDMPDKAESLRDSIGNIRKSIAFFTRHEAIQSGSFAVEGEQKYKKKDKDERTQSLEKTKRGLPYRSTTQVAKFQRNIEIDPQHAFEHIESEKVRAAVLKLREYLRSVEKKTVAVVKCGIKYYGPKAEGSKSQQREFGLTENKEFRFVSETFTEDEAEALATQVNIFDPRKEKKDGEHAYLLGSKDIDYIENLHYEQATKNWNDESQYFATLVGTQKIAEFRKPKKDEFYILGEQVSYEEWLMFNYIADIEAKKAGGFNRLKDEAKLLE